MAEFDAHGFNQSILAQLQEVFNTELDVPLVEEVIQLDNLADVLVKTVSDALSKNQIRKDGKTNGDLYRVVKTLGADPLNFEDAFFYGGSTNDIPLGLDVTLVEIISPDKIKFRNNGSSVFLHPEEVEYTGRNIFDFEDKTSVADIIQGIIKKNQELHTRKIPLENRYEKIESQNQGTYGHSFSIITSQFEKEMVRLGRTDIQKLNSRTLIHDEEMQRMLDQIRFHSGDYRMPVQKLKRSVIGLSSPFSMKMKDMDEVMGMVSVLYQIAHDMYILNKKSIQNYPFWMCESGMRNLLYNLYDHGFVASVRGYTTYRWYHNFVNIPFVLEDNQRGLMTIDPTAEQNMSYGIYLPKNFIMVCGEGLNYKYPISTKSHVRYFPDEIEFPLIEKGKYKGMEIMGGDRFLKKAFENPQKVS